MPRSKKSKTHFEQVPLEIVKDIVQEDIPEASADEAIIESPKKSPHLKSSRSLWQIGRYGAKGEELV